MINFNSFKNIHQNVLTFSKNASKINNFHLNKTNKYQNLKPLSVDTFTFTGCVKETERDNDNKSSIRELYKALMTVDNKNTCQLVYKNAEESTNELRKFLNSTLGDLIIDKDNPDKPIEQIAIRIKTPESIREKTAKILAENIINKPQNAFNLYNPEDIKNNIRDIVGARIVLRNPGNKNTKDIISRLTAEVSKKDSERFLKINKIESYVPENEKGLAYFKEEDLEALRDAENCHRRKDDKIKIVTNEKDTGYIAVHLDLDLSNPDKYVTSKNDYFGEIQILGSDVADLKEVEDLCYKLKGGNDIKSGNVAYKPFSKYFIQHISSTPDAKDNFTKYTSRAYALQRQKEPISNYKREKNIQLPTIQDCRLEGKVPPQLDFNILNKIKSDCDRLYELTYNID